MSRLEMFGVCAECRYNDETCSMCERCVDASRFIAKQKIHTSDHVDGGNIKDDPRSIVANAKRGKILLKALEIINGERQNIYGKPEDSFKLIGEYWTNYLRSKNSFEQKATVVITPKNVAEMMMLFKIARMSGQKPSLDNYLDLVGYAGIAADMLEEK